MTSTPPVPATPLAYLSYEELEEMLRVDLLGYLFGGVITASLYGITTVQTVLYFQRFRDPRVIQALVLALNVLQISLLINGIQDIFRGIEKSHGDILADLQSDGIRQCTMYATLLVESALVQGIFLSRIWILSRKWWLTAAAGACIIAQVTVGLAWVIQWTHVGVMYPHERLYDLYMAWFVCTLLADLVIASILAILLLRRRTSIPLTNTLLNKLVLYSISTGMVTAILGIVCLAAAIKLAISLLVVASSVHGSSYVVVMLANLHSRTYILNMEKAQRAGVHLDDVALSPMASSAQYNTSQDSSTQSPLPPFFSISPPPNPHEEEIGEIT